MIKLSKENRFLKFLGIIIDENLTWRKHISVLETKIARAIGVLYKARSFINERNRKLLYFSLIHSHLNSANIVWGSTHKSKLNKLYGLQKHACKVVNFKSKYDSGERVLKSMNIINIFDLNIMHHLIFMFKLKNRQLPEIFQSYFEPNVSINYNLRSNSSGNFCLPAKHSKFTEHSIYYRGPKLWNIFSDKEIKSSKSLFIFKRRLKDFLLNKV